MTIPPFSEIPFAVSLQQNTSASVSASLGKRKLIGETSSQKVKKTCMLPPFSEIPFAVSLQQNTSASVSATLEKRKLLEETSSQKVKKTCRKPDLNRILMPPPFCSSQLDRAIIQTVSAFFQSEIPDPMAISFPSWTFSASDSTIQITNNRPLPDLSLLKSSLEENSSTTLFLNCSPQGSELNPMFQSFFPKCAPESATPLISLPCSTSQAQPVFSTNCEPVHAGITCRLSLEQKLCDVELAELLKLETESLGSKEDNKDLFEATTKSSITDNTEGDEDFFEAATKSFRSLSLLGKGGAFAKRN